MSQIKHDTQKQAWAKAYGTQT